MISEKVCLTCDRLVFHQQLACWQPFCAVLNGKNILVYTHVDLEEPLKLTGHHSDITVMTFGKSNRPVLLCSASADYIIIWDVERCQKRAREGKIAVGTIISTLLGNVAHLSFSFSDDKVAACIGDTVYILNSNKQETISSLTGHLGALTSAEFCPWNNSILVTTSEDRTFKVWDLNTEAVYYESFVLTGSPLVSGVFLSETRHLVTGSLDGQVWCFSLTDENKCHLVTKTDLHKIEKRHKIHQEFLGQRAENTKDFATADVWTSKPISKMELCFLIDTSNDQKMSNSWICIGSSDGLYMLDLATSELLTVLYFKDYPELSITMAGSYSTSIGQNNLIHIFVSSLFTPCVALLEINLCDLQKTWAGGEGFSVFPSASPAPDSLLNATFKKKHANLPKKKGIKDQALVFHTKVKSSGYTSAPRRIMFAPKTNVKKDLSSTKTNKTKCFLVRDYPDDCAAQSISNTEYSTSNSPVYCVEYSGDGKQVLCGLGDCSVLLCKPCLAGSSSVYTGHDKKVTSVSWSINRQWWLSASEDQTVRIWTHKNQEPAIIMNNREFTKPIRGAQFYYLDKFVLVASGPTLHLYLYDVDTNTDDIKRYHQLSSMKLMKSLPISATDISAMSSINDFLSYIVLVCGSDRSIQVFDMNRGANAAEVPNAHSRVIHCITQNKGSLFSSQAPDSYNLFLTSAVTDGIKIWDLRTLRCVRRYENHVNRCHSCCSAISPCGRYIATGSEDNCAYVYDVRSSSYLYKLQKESSAVLRVAFNPSTPELLTGTLDGKLRRFQPSTGACLSQHTNAVA